MTGGLVERSAPAWSMRSRWGRMGQPADIAAAVVYLASEEAAWVTALPCTSMAAWR